MIQTQVFDTEYAIQITKARMNFLNKCLPDLIIAEGLKRTLDVGCGVGYFSSYLASLNLKVIAFDRRPENVTEAQRRHKDIKFIVHNIEDPTVKDLGSFDLVLCFGLLYHLENPFMAVRNLYSLTEKILLIESMVTPNTFPIASLVDEGNSEDQSLNYIAFVLSESGLVKMLYRAGFCYVYGSSSLPNHEDFRETFEFQRKRVIIIASKMPLKLPFLCLLPEPKTENLWIKPLGYQLKRLCRFLRKPWKEKIVSIRSRFKQLWNRMCPSIPLPIRLPYGGWWLAENDVCGDVIFTSSFENAEWRFVENFLKKGMTVLDIGAHHGFYTILASKKVGPHGRVIAFEPSPRERQRLLLHLKLNRCTNVKVESLALASRNGKTTLYIVNGRDTGCNSLRPPVVSEPTKVITVKTIALDNYLGKENIHHVDFLKMDVEGAELEVLKGALKLLQLRPRPVILCEVDDCRTKPWGYPAQEIIELLESYGFQWFGLNSEGQLAPLGQRDSYNLVAFPEEGIADLPLPFAKYINE